MLNQIDVTTDGSGHCNIDIHDDRFYRRIVKDGSLGFGEGYMDAWWDCDNLSELFYRIFRKKLNQYRPTSIWLLLQILSSRIFNMQTVKRALKVGRVHYDLGNDLYEKMLDPTMTYSCGYWRDTDSLHQAQLNKFDLLCRKLMLKKSDRLLDIGCGWGGMAKYAAEHYGVEVVGVTISKQQYEYAKNVCKDLPVDIRLLDYRKLNERFDKIVSVGMFEHVGYKNYRTFMEVVDRCLVEQGLFCLHTIGTYEPLTHGDPWMDRYIFPDGMLPCPSLVTKAAENLFLLEDWHCFGLDYAKTTQAWHDNFIDAWDELKHHYSERFYRMWRYYLNACIGGFRAREMGLWQIVFSKEYLGGYVAAR